MASSTMTIRLEASEKELISDYAAAFGMTLSEFVRQSILEKIEDELDLRDWYAAKAEFDADPEIISSEEIARKHL
ncbi:MAG: CopG family transcriptional regulator [Eggerthellaceae bacterium]|nr:CopG family transcriptional regulator [Eggerthellaceae bacterium]